MDTTDESQDSNCSSSTRSSTTCMDIEDRKGIEKSMLPRSFGKKLFPSLVRSANHTVLFKIPIDANNAPEPYPQEFRDCWDSTHVKMPCSKHNVFLEKEYVCTSTNNFTPENLKINRWNVIKDSLQKPISSSKDLEKSILSYNHKYKKIWRFHLLHSFFNECLTEEETDEFFSTLLPKMIKLALKLPTLITSPIPLLKQNKSHSISLSQMQIACLLANAFLCTFPHRNDNTRSSEYATYPHINFSGLFQLRASFGTNDYLFEKLRCIVCYFNRITSAESTDLKGVVTYSRRCISDGETPLWLNSTSQLTNLYATSKGTIEDDGDGMFQVDFANKFIGGGVLHYGSVQEEIRFLICPELLVSQLFSEQMLSTEAIIITGVERFSDYSGYANSFEWKNSHKDGTPSDEFNRRYCTVVAIDAIFFEEPIKQYEPKNLRRELNKAYAGFSWGQSSECSDVSIATGNWGCGAFQGDCHLKSLLQFVCAAQAKRDIAYFTFGNIELQNAIYDMHKFLKKQNVTVGEICKILISYNKHLTNNSSAKLYDFIYDAVYKTKAQDNEKPIDADVSREPIVSKATAAHCSSANVIGSTPEKLASDPEPSTSDRIDSQNNVNTERLPDVKFLPVNQFKLNDDRERAMCIKQQKNSWLQLNNSKKDFESSVGKSSAVGSLSSLKRDREGHTPKPRVKRKISDYFVPKS